MSTHALENMFAGDDWVIKATLLDESGNPYDLSGSPTIQWTLMDAQGERVIESNEVTYTITNSAQGKCTVVVPHTVTTRLAGDMYTDVLRLTISNVVSTLSVGQILVYTDPWAAAAVAMIPNDFKRAVTANHGHVLGHAKFGTYPKDA